MNHELTDSDLSAVGRRRRDAMRDELLTAFVTLHQARRTRRRVAASAALVAIIASAGWVGARYAGRVEPAGAPGDIVASNVLLVEIIETATTGRSINFATLVEGSSSLVIDVDDSSSLVQMLGDDALVETLEQMERPAGLIEMGGTVRLTRNVVDDDSTEPVPGRGSGLGHPLVPGNSTPATGV
jgi:hypothetical protein